MSFGFLQVLESLTGNIRIFFCQDKQASGYLGKQNKTKNFLEFRKKLMNGSSR